MITKDFKEFTLYMFLKIFLENSHYRNGRFQKNRKNHIKSELVKIWKFTLVTPFMIPLYNENWSIEQNGISMKSKVDQKLVLEQRTFSELNLFMTYKETYT